MTRRRRALALAAWVVCGVATARAGGPPIPTEPPQLFSRIGYWKPGGAALETQVWVQFARPESLDLVRVAPRVARLPRVEASIHPDLLVLQPRAGDPETYRVRVPVGSPIACNYTCALQAGPEAAHVVGPDYLCVWLGEALLAPLRPEKPLAAATLPGVDPAALDTAAGVERFWLETQLPDHWHAYGPWRTDKKVFRAESLSDQIDNFLALGVWRAAEQPVGEAAACTLQVALAGLLPVPDAAWRARAGREVAAAGVRGRALVCVAPVPGPLRVLRARRSWLVLWPADRTALPPEGAANAAPQRPFDWIPHSE